MTVGYNARSAADCYLSVWATCYMQRRL